MNNKYSTGLNNEEVLKSRKEYGSNISVLMFFGLWQIFQAVCLVQHCFICRNKGLDFPSVLKSFYQILIYSNSLIVQITKVKNLISRICHIGFRTQVKILEGTENTFACPINECSHFHIKNFSMPAQ